MLTVTGLVRHFQAMHSGSVPVRAVDGVSFTLADGELVGLTGESGCGKSTLARTLLRLVEPTSGTVELDGTQVTALSRSGLRKFRPRMQLISQDPESAFNPRNKIGESVAEPFRVLHGVSLKKAIEMSEDYLSMAGFDMELVERYPFELSGGQIQRAAVARALAGRPSLIVADEPTSSLDPSAQAQIAQTFQRINSEHGISLLWISHDLPLLSCVCDRIAVMHAGKIVECGPPGDITIRPVHHATRSPTDIMSATLSDRPPVGVLNEEFYRESQYRAARDSSGTTVRPQNTYSPFTGLQTDDKTRSRHT